MILHEGNIAEMRTGEGKTLVAVLPSYLNALAGKVADIACRQYVSNKCSMVQLPCFAISFSHPLHSYTMGMQL